MENERKVEETPIGFAKSYGVSLYFGESCDLSITKMIELFEERIGEVSVYDEEEALVSLVFENYMQTEGMEKAKYKIEVLDRGPEDHVFDAYTSQSWDWPECKGLKGRVNYQILLTDEVGSEMDYKVRIALFQVVLYTLVEYLKPMAIAWPSSGQLINPEVYLSNIPGEETYDLLYGPLNVRVFNVNSKEGAQESEGDMLMDTMGLAALGVVDVQCYFFGYDTEDMANLLYRYGRYIFWNGDIIKEGETIEGVKPGEKWGVRHELSLTEPRRSVLNVGPEVKL